MDVVTLINAAVQILLTLVGFPAFLAAVLSILMKFGVSADVASTISFVANAVALVGIAYLVFTGQSALVAVIDASLGGLAKLLVDVLIIIGGPAVTLSLTGSFTRSLAAHSSNFAEAKRLL